MNRSQVCNCPEVCPIHPKHEGGHHEHGHREHHEHHGRHEHHVHGRHEHEHHEHGHHEHEHHKEKEHAKIHVVNEDSGHEFKIDALLDKPVQAAIDQVYDKLRLTRKPDDRLRCECNGNDVFAHAQMTMREYLKKEICPGRTWLFASGTGGALGKPSPVDPEVASATLWKHLDELWQTGRPSRLGWTLTKLDALTAIVMLPGKRADGVTDEYYLRLDGKYYDAFPAVVTFVDPETAITTGGLEVKTWPPAIEGTRWFPKITPLPWFQLHNQYRYPDGQQRQLVCFSASADYYLSNHNPTPTQVWRQGEQTVAKTLNRLAEVLSQPHYKGPSKC